MNLDASTILQITLLAGQMVVKYGPGVAALWQRIIESGKLPTADDYAETERIIDKDARGYFKEKV